MCDIWNPEQKKKKKVDFFPYVHKIADTTEGADMHLCE